MFKQITKLKNIIKILLIGMILWFVSATINESFSSYVNTLEYSNVDSSSYSTEELYNFEGYYESEDGGEQKVEALNENLYGLNELKALQEESTLNNTYYITSNYTVDESTQETQCRIIAEGQFANQEGTNGLEGALWHLCEGGLLEIGKGFINWTGNSSPWSEYNYYFGYYLPQMNAGYRGYISEIVFTGAITAGESLRYLFSLDNVRTIRGLEHFDTSSVTDMSSMFERTSNLIDLDISRFDTSQVTNMSRMFHTTGMTSLNLSHFNTSQVTDMSEIFAGINSLTGLDISSFDTSQVTDMSRMFSGVSSLTILDVSNFDTSQVRDMTAMFGGMSSLTILDISNFDTSQVENMHGMFSGARGLTSLDISNFDTSQVRDMGLMFADKSSLLSIDISNFDTSRVTSMRMMFRGTRSLTDLDLSNFDTSHVESMYGMFSEARSLTSLDISSFSTSLVRDMNAMFRGVSGLTILDISNFDTRNVMHMDSMFAEMTSMRELSLGEAFEFVEGDFWWSLGANL